MGERFAEWDGVLRAVHAKVRRLPAAFAEAGHWLDTSFSPREVWRWRAAAERGESAPAWAHQVGTPGGVDPRLVRLSAVTTFLSNEPPDLSITALEDPQRSARRVLLVVALLTDRRAAEYAASLTTLAELPFDGQGVMGGMGRGWLIPDGLKTGDGAWATLVRAALAALPDPRAKVRRRAAGGMENSDVKRLRIVRDRVRELVRYNAWLGAEIRAAFKDFVGLVDRYVAGVNDMRRQEEEMARDVLQRGFVMDPLCADNRPCIFVYVRGLCPVELAKPRRKPPTRKAERELERQRAAAALAAMDRNTIYQSRTLSDRRTAQMAREYRKLRDAGTHVEHKWRVVIPKPEDWKEPPDPRSPDRLELERFSEDEYRTIALYFLGGLADTGAIRPALREPESTGDLMVDVPNYAAFRTRYPTPWREHLAQQPPLDPAHLPPDVAEQMLDDLEVWVTRRESGTDQPPPVVPEQSPSEGARPRPTLTRDHETILRHLAKAPTRCQTVIDIAGNCSIRNRETAGKRLRELADYGLVHRPYGVKKGYAITTAGLSWLNNSPP